MLAIRGIGKTISNYMVFDPAVGPWRTVSLYPWSDFIYNSDLPGGYRWFTEIFSPIYDFTIVEGIDEYGFSYVSNVTARFPTGVPIKLRLLKPEYFSTSEDPFLPFEYKFPVFYADGLDGFGAGPGLDEPWRLIELNLSNVPFTEIRVANNGLQLLDVSGNDMLSYLDCSLNNLTDAAFNMADSGFLYEEEGEMVRAMDTLNARSNNLSTAPYISTSNASVYRYDVANNRIPTINVAKRAPYVFDVSNQFPDDPAQGLTSLTFSDEINRPAYWYVQNNRLTSLAMGVAGVGEANYLGWGAVRELKCANNLIAELLFPDGQPPVNWWTQGTSPGGYQLHQLDVSGNPLTTLNLEHVDTLLELNISDTSITSLALAPNTVTTYLNPRNDSGLDTDYNLGTYSDGAPDVVTGDWRNVYGQFGMSIPTSALNDPESGYYYRHTRGIRKLTARNCPLASWPANTMALREVYISNATALTRIGGSNESIRPVFSINGNYFGTATTNPWRRIFGNVSHNGAFGITVATNVDYADPANLFGAAYSPQRLVAVFRNLRWTQNPPPGMDHPENGTLYMLHRAVIAGSTIQLYFTDRIDLEAMEFGGAPFNTPPTQGSIITFNGLNSQSNFGLVPEVALYTVQISEADGVTGFPYLEVLEVENCPNLSRIRVQSAGFLKKLVVRDCPNLTGRLVDNQSVGFSDPLWTGGSSHLTHIEVVNTDVSIVVSDRNPSYKRQLDQVRVQNSVGSGAPGVRVRFGASFSDGNGYVCRNGVWLTNLGTAATATDSWNWSGIDLALRRAMQWSFSPALPTDSNVISFAGSFYPLSRKAANYDVHKAGAISRGWQVIDPTFV